MKPLTAGVLGACLTAAIALPVMVWSINEATDYTRRVALNRGEYIGEAKLLAQIKSGQLDTRHIEEFALAYWFGTSDKLKAKERLCK